MPTFSNKTIQNLLEIAKQPGRGGMLTQAGHALQKHANRSGSAFSGTIGPESAWNQKSEHILEQILSDPGATTRNKFIPREGNVIDIIDSTGKGARFSQDLAKLIGFLEP